MNLKEEILATARELFTVKGYEKTTVSEIIEKAGTSKGGFYHHFRSKDEVLEAITLSYVEEAKAFYDNILVSDLTVVEKFSHSFYQIGELKKKYISQWPSIKKIFSFPGNHILLHKMAEEFQKITTEFYHQLILEGNEEGVFFATFPYEAAQLWSREVITFHRIANKLFWSNDKESNKRFHNMLEFNQNLIHHLLGLKDTKLDLVTLGEEYVKSIQLALKEEKFL